jgi:hypothetical protein
VKHCSTDIYEAFKESIALLGQKTLHVIIQRQSVNVIKTLEQTKKGMKDHRQHRFTYLNNSAPNAYRSA